MHRTDGHRASTSADRERRRVEPHRARRARSATRRRPSTELLTLNIGPHHPATHGVLRLLVDARGRVRARRQADHRLRPHRHREDAPRTSRYWKVIPVVERMDYLSYYFNAMAYCGAVETLLERRGPARARSTCASSTSSSTASRRHLIWLGTGALDLGAVSVLLVLLARARADPRPVRDVVRPAHAHALLPGRRRHRGHPARLGARSCASSSR